MRTTRSSAETHLFMDLSPCECGETEFDRDSRVVTRGADRVSIYEAACPRCGRQRRFEIRLPARPWVSPDLISYGGPEPSQLIDAGQYLAVSDRFVQRASAGEAHAREHAIAALKEVLKFIPAGLTAVPDGGFFSEPGRRLRTESPARFQRDRLEAELAQLERQG